MARYSNVQSNFSGGLVTDHLVGRIDIDRMANSGRKFENFLPTVQGPAEYRPGFQNKTEETNLSYLSSVSESITFAGNVSYRAVFGGNEVTIYNNEGLLIDTVSTPYGQSELQDLRFSSETNELYIAHPLYKPRVLTGTSGFTFNPDFLHDNAGNNLLTSEGKQLTVNAGIVQGSGDWSLNEVDTKVEPFLEADTSLTKVRIVKDQEIAKIVSTDTALATIAGAPTATDYYIEYEIEGKKVLGKVLDATSSTNYAEVADPSYDAVSGEYTIYVDAVDFVTTITDPDTKLFLLDNQTTYSPAIKNTQLEQEGVPSGDVVVRSDVDVFNNSNVGSWLRLDSSNRSKNTLHGEDAKYGLTRWVKIIEYKSIETHPVEFYRGEKYIQEKSGTHDYTVYDSGSVYKAFGDSEFTIEDIAGNTAGEVRSDGNRVFVWNGGAFRGDTLLVYNDNITRNSADIHFTIPTGHNIKVGDTINISGLSVTSGTSPNGDQTVVAVEADKVHFTISGLSHDPTGDATLTVKSHNLGTNSIVGNLSTAVSFDVVDCDSSLEVQEYDAVLNTGGLLVKTTATNTIVTEIANDVLIEASADLFDQTRDVDRHMRVETLTGMVYTKILAVNNAREVRARLNTPVPRDNITGEYEGNGVGLSFSLGAWYTNNFPKTVTKYEQRRIYGGTLTNPNLVFISRLSDDTDFSPTQPDKIVLDTDGITYALSNINAGISWMKAASDLIIGTSRGIFKLVINQFQASISPKTIRFTLVDEIGCFRDGVLAGTSVFFPDESNTELLEYKFDNDSGIEVTEDVSKLVYPTFVNDTIKKVVYQNNPQPRIWVLTEEGLLYCLTYNRQENYYAWSKHTHGGVSGSNNTKIIDITVLRKGFDSNLDQVWITAENAGDFRIAYEVMFSENDTGNEITYFIDSGVKRTIDIATAKVGNQVQIDLTGTPYESGGQVSVVYDGIVKGIYVLSGSTLNIVESRSTGTVEVVFGKNYTGTLQMMYPTWDARNKPAFGTETQRVISQKIFVINSSTFAQGVDGLVQSVDLPGFDSGVTSASGVFTGFDIERPLRNSQFGVDKIPELVQTQPYRTIFGSLVTKVDLN